MNQPLALVFIAAGILTMLALFFPDQAIVILMASILGAALIAIVYSYLAYRQEEKKLA
jgi:predicted membrane channel-forming protein YqfA (hemolysin III family)